MNICSRKNIFQQCIFEFLGTGLIIFFGTGFLTASKLTNFYLSQYEMSFIWGCAVSFSIYLSIAISGAHLNPAITICFWLFYKFNKQKVLPYIISQISGTFFFNVNILYISQNIYIVRKTTSYCSRNSREPSISFNFLRLSSKKLYIYT
nr:aquaporin [Buchnera aphidicola]